MVAGQPGVEIIMTFVFMTTMVIEPQRRSRFRGSYSPRSARETFRSSEEGFHRAEVTFPA